MKLSVYPITHRMLLHYRQPQTNGQAELCRQTRRHAVSKSKKKGRKKTDLGRDAEAVRLVEHADALHAQLHDEVVQHGEVLVVVPRPPHTPLFNRAKRQVCATPPPVVVTPMFQESAFDTWGVSATRCQVTMGEGGNHPTARTTWDSSAGLWWTFHHDNSAGMGPK